MIGSTHFWNNTFDALVTGAATTEINPMEMVLDFAQNFDGG